VPDSRGCFITITFLLCFRIRRQEGPRKQKRECNRTQQLLVYVDVNLFGGKKTIIKTNTETILDASKDVGLEVNAEKSK
jgi:hypothetical protein